MLMVLTGTGDAHMRTVSHLRTFRCHHSPLLSDLRGGDLQGLKKEEIRKLFPEVWARGVMYYWIPGTLTRLRFPKHPTGVQKAQGGQAQLPLPGGVGGVVQGRHRTCPADHHRARAAAAQVRTCTPRAMPALVRASPSSSPAPPAPFTTLQRARGLPPRGAAVHLRVLHGRIARGSSFSGL